MFIRNIKLILFCSIIVIYSFASCSKVSLSSKHELNDTTNALAQKSSRIDKKTVALTEEDAATIAKLFVNNGPNTRTDVAKTIRDIVSVKDDNSETLLYGVNFNNGYVLIPANKYSFPILADVENGYFDGEKTESGADVLLNEIKASIKAANENPELRVNRSVWSSFEKNDEIKIPLQTRTDLDDALNDLMYNLGADGWTVYALAHQPEDMPDDLYDIFCDAAFNENGEDPDYDYMYYSIIAEKPFQSITTKGPYLTTSWGQQSPYNEPYSNALGCTTIAAGQIMRFFEYPGYSSSFPYTLSVMPNSISSYNSNLCGFLYNLKNTIGVDSNGGATINEVRNALINYGYSISKIVHNSTSVINAIDDGRPVYMRGEDSGYGGHAWVCDGYLMTDSYNKYQLYIFRYEDGVPSYYDLELDETGNHFHHFMFHMNWGWYGDRNGYYFDSNLLLNNITIDGSSVNYNPGSNRKDLIINIPNI